jgi:hypothetical protein
LSTEIDTKTAFALLLEAASKQFKVLQSLIRGELSIVSHPQPGVRGEDLCNLRAPTVIQMALAKEFLFNAVRAFRIIEHSSTGLDIARGDRKSFLASLRPIVVVRDVNEHAYDPNKGNRGKSSRPTQHHHVRDSVSLDETSLVVSGPEKILMGPLNLATVFEPVEAMRRTAGFAALRKAGF